MTSKEEDQVKIKNLKLKLAECKEDIKQQNLSSKKSIKKIKAENKYLKRRVKELSLSRDVWKNKHKEKQAKIKQLKVQLKRAGKAKWHHYTTWLVTLSILLRVKCNCSYESTIKILMLLNSYFHLGLDKLPCRNTVQNWVSKVGLYSLEKEPSKWLNQEVSIIIDESIRLGQEKLLLILQCPWIKQMKGALKFTDIEVVYMKGSKSWKGIDIAKEITESLLAKGVKIMNVLSDEGGNLKTATQKIDLPHLPDIGHALATCLRQTFDKEEAYVSFTKLIASYLAKGVNQDLSYLCPPKLGRKARFMNQARVINWAEQMLKNWRKLSEVEKVFFAQLKAQKTIMKSLTMCMTIAKIVALPLKEEGLSIKTLEKIEEKLKCFEKKRGYIKVFLTKVQCYLKKYKAFLSNYREGICIHVSSDIIESIFGKYKFKANNYALTGLTKLNLELPLFCKTEKEIIQLTHLALEDISMTYLGQWVVDHSADNQLVRKLKFREK